MYQILDYTGEILYEGETNFSTIAGIIVGLFTLFKGSLILRYEEKQYIISQNNFNNVLREYIKEFGFLKEDILTYNNYTETGYYIWIAWTDYKYNLYLSENKDFINGFISALGQEDFRNYIYGPITFYQNGKRNDLTIENKYISTPVIPQEFYDIPYSLNSYQDGTDYF